MSTRRGPSTPRWSQTEDEPGPPLKEKVSGRPAGSVTSSRVYATKKNVAFGFAPSETPSWSPRFSASCRSTSVPVVTV